MIMHSNSDTLKKGCTLFGLSHPTGGKGPEKSFCNKLGVQSPENPKGLENVHLIRAALQIFEAHIRLNSQEGIMNQSNDILHVLLVGHFDSCVHVAQRNGNQG